MNTKELLGLKVKAIRKQRKITQEHLSEHIGVDNGYISKLEVGQNFPSIGTLEKIANAINVDLAELFQFTNEKNTDCKSEILRIYDILSREKQLTLYKVAKGLEK